MYLRFLVASERLNPALVKSRTAKVMGLVDGMTLDRVGAVRSYERVRPGIGTLRAIGQSLTFSTLLRMSCVVRPAALSQGLTEIPSTLSDVLCCPTEHLKIRKFSCET